MVTTNDTGNVVIGKTTDNKDDYAYSSMINHTKHQAGVKYPDGGLPNIDGWVEPVMFADNDESRKKENGALYWNHTYIYDYTANRGSGAGIGDHRLGIDASKLNNGYGRYQVLGSTGNVIPSHIAVIAWQREE